MRAQAQAELQHVEGRVGVAPFGQLVAPGGVELRAPELLGILRREGVGDRAVLPFQPPARRGPLRALGARGDGEQAARPLDHHLAHVVLGLAHQRDVHVPLRGVRRVSGDLRAHPFGAQPRLAGAAPAQHQPGGPGAAVARMGARDLVRQRQRDEVTREEHQVARRQRRQQRLRPACLRSTPQCAAQARHGRHRDRRAGRHRFRLR